MVTIWPLRRTGHRVTPGSTDGVPSGGSSPSTFERVTTTNCQYLTTGLEVILAKPIGQKVVPHIGAVRLDQTTLVGYASGMTLSRHKLYAYVDESGQDTVGGFFVVGVLVLSDERALVRQQLEQLEQQTGKGRVKWTR